MWISQENVNRRRAQSNQSPSPQGTQAPLCLRFPKSLRILKRTTYKDIARNRNRFVGNMIVIDYRHSDHLQMGLIVTRKFGIAAKRNRFKRLAREAFRHLASNMPPLQLIIIPKHGCTSYSFDGMIHDLNQLVGKYAQSSAGKSC